MTYNLGRHPHLNEKIGTVWEVQNEERNEKKQVTKPAFCRIVFDHDKHVRMVQLKNVRKLLAEELLDLDRREIGLEGKDDQNSTEQDSWSSWGSDIDVDTDEKKSALSN